MKFFLPHQFCSVPQRIQHLKNFQIDVRKEEKRFKFLKLPLIDNKNERKKKKKLNLMVVK